MATHSNILPGKSLGQKEPGGLQSIGSQKSWTCHAFSFSLSLPLGPAEEQKSTVQGEEHEAQPGEAFGALRNGAEAEWDPGSM